MDGGGAYNDGTTFTDSSVTSITFMSYTAAGHQGANLMFSSALLMKQVQHIQATELTANFQLCFNILSPASIKV